MKYNYFLVLVICVLNIQCTNKKDSKFVFKKLVIDELHGQKIEDPYRYMENLNDTVVIDWLKDQKAYKEKTINGISGRNRLKSQIEKFQKVSPEKVSKLYVTNDDLYFYLKENASENIKRLYYRKGFSGKEQLLFDPKDFDKNDKHIINYIKPSWDSSKIVIGLTKNDEEFSSIIILDLNIKQLLSNIDITNTMPNSLGGIKWLPDDSGLVYTYVPVTNSKAEGYLFNTKSVLYKFGKKSNKKTTLLSKKNNPKMVIKEEDFPIIYPGKKYMLGVVAGVSRYRDTYIARAGDLNKNIVKWKPLYKKEERIRQFTISDNDLIYMTSKNAANFEISKTSLDNPNFENPEKLVLEDRLAVITDYAITSKGLFYVKVKNGVDAKLYQLKDGIEKLIPIPQSSGSISVSSKNINFDDLWIKIEGWTHGKRSYKYNFEKEIFVSEDLFPVVNHQALNDVVVEEIEIMSHDGVKLPLSILYKKGIKLNGKNGILLSGYGAYGVTNKPRMDKYLLNWINEGGVYASAHVRGGGEKGDAWHKGGFKSTKPNTWKDFISSAEYLINNKYTSKAKLAVWSGSAGGILIGRAITERPDLFGAAIIRVGLLNTLRSEFAPNGKNNTKEFGTVKDPEEFKALLEMDSYHHVKDNVDYPAVYLTAGMKDARVAAWQPAKFAVRLQEATSSKKPVILDIDFEGGHGFGATTNKKNEELANILAFAFWQTGHPDYQLKD